MYYTRVSLQNETFITLLGVISVLGGPGGQAGRQAGVAAGATVGGSTAPAARLAILPCPAYKITHSLSHS